MPRLLPLLALLGAFAGPPDDAADVRAAFEGYKQALLAADGAAAAAAVDRNTIAYYDRMRDLARRGDAETVRALPTADLLMVLTIRHRVPPDTLRTMDAPGLLAHAVTEGWIGRDGVEAQAIGDVRVAADTAYGALLVGGQPAGLEWTFHREDGRWRLDLSAMMAGASAELDAAILDAGMGREDFIFTVLGMVTGTAPDASIWTPSDQR